MGLAHFVLSYRDDARRVNIYATHPALGGVLMKVRQAIGILLIVVGLISLLMGGISWTREKTVIDLGPIEAKTRERETIPLPPIVGGLLLAGGVILLVVRSPRHA